MMKVGITGGIGSGKSTVCRLFARLGVAVYDSDALLAVAADAAGVQRVVAAGSWQALADHYTHREGVEVVHLPGKLLAPGFVDLHIHYPQTDVIGAPAPGLLPWLGGIVTSAILPGLLATLVVAQLALIAIAVGLGAWLAGERFGAHELMAMGVILLGVVAITLAKARKTKVNA